MTDLSEWFKERPIWVQNAAQCLIQHGEITSTDLEELVKLCKKEAVEELDSTDSPTPQMNIDDTFQTTSSQESLRLKAIKNVVGVNALAPRKPLEFGEENLTIIYGATGVGKSSYMRLLKHICGARSPGNLLGNVFNSKSQDQKCKINYTVNGEEEEIEWKIENGILPKLKDISIYDTDCAYFYVDKEHEVSFEPPLLGFFHQLVNACGEVEAIIRKEIESNVSKLPLLPTEYKNTDESKWFEAISHDVPDEDITLHCSWTDEDSKTLDSIKKRLSEENPQRQADNIQKTYGYLSQLIKDLKEIKKRLSDKAFGEFQDLKRDAETKRRVATEDADKVFTNAPLDGVASESWRLLWEQARKYSEQDSYPGIPFPNIDEDSRCVLCQQILSGDAKERMESFERFIKGTLEIEASEAEKKVKMISEKQSNLFNEQKLDLTLDLSGISQKEIREDVIKYCKSLKKREDIFLVEGKLSKLPKLPKDKIYEILKSIENSYVTKIALYKKDAQGIDDEDLIKRKNELEARKWLSEQKEPIENDIDRKKKNSNLKKAMKLTHTRALTDKATSLSKILVTKAFIGRFNDELKKLGAKNIKVGIEKIKTTKSHILHKLILRDAISNAKTRDVLSEGEFRISSISAFLADVAAEDNDVPFIFDDPISSLDQNYEEKVAKRLVELSKSRQVIVFTHRLSLLSEIENAGIKQVININVVSLQKETWGAGEPGNPPLPAQKPKKALKTLSNERLSKAKKVHSENGHDDYVIYAKALCGDIRITIERLIEYDLLADVIQRFRRPINTMGKLEKIAKVTSKDCQYLDEMMTKYSRYEHSQPGEAPVELPEPDELEEDLNGLKDWLDEFSKREVKL